MPILKLDYHDLKEKVIKLGTMEYHFDPTCDVENEDHVRWLMRLKPPMFVIVTEKEAELLSISCPICGKCADEFKDLRGFNGHVRWCTKKFNADNAVTEDLPDESA